MPSNVIKGLLAVVALVAGAFGFDVAFSERAVEVLSLVVSAFAAGSAFVTIKPKSKAEK
jgi:hypothetical protein